MTEFPLSDITVLDFSQSAAGPYTAQLLAEYGAEVTAVEPPGGGQQRSLVEGSFFPNLSHNKESITLDLKSKDAPEILERLVEDADVVVHNYLPEVASRLGLDYESIREINDEIIYCSVTGFGETGPYRDRPAMEPTVESISGLLSMTGEPDRKPSRIGCSPIDFGTGMIGAFGILAALRLRDRTGEGEKLEVSLFDTAAAFMGYWYTYDSKYGRVPQRQGHTSGGYAPVGCFETGGDMIYICIPYEGLWERFCKLLDKEEWLEDPRYETPEPRIEHRDELYEAIEQEFRTYDREELLEGLYDIGIPAAPVQSVSGAAEDEHLEFRGTVSQIRDTDGDEVTVANQPVKTSGPLPEIKAPPRAGEQTESVLERLGFGESEIEKLYANGTVE